MYARHKYLYKDANIVYPYGQRYKIYTKQFGLRIKKNKTYTKILRLEIGK